MTKPLPFLLNRITTPIGEMLVAADHGGNLRAVDWTDYEARMLELLRRHYGPAGFHLEPGAISDSLSDPIARYFLGDLTALDSLPVATAGTAFQRKVWRALREIPCGQTITYASLAGRIGNPKAVRAVGSANGSNPVGVVVPCHRVIGTDGSLTGYGGGLERKRWLLAHEAAHALAASKTSR